MVAALVAAWIEMRCITVMALLRTRSRPLWPRGLKFDVCRHFRVHEWSRPLWPRGLKLIQAIRTSLHAVSRPLWPRGLKLQPNNGQPLLPIVAALVAAWIEIMRMAALRKQTGVAAFAAAWIEISSCHSSTYCSNKSRPLRPRGLKFNNKFEKKAVIFVAALVAAWIEIVQ